MKDDDAKLLAWLIVAILLLLGQLAALGWLFWFDWRLALVILALQLSIPKSTD